MFTGTAGVSPAFVECHDVALTDSAVFTGTAGVSPASLNAMLSKFRDFIRDSSELTAKAGETPAVPVKR